MNGDPMAGGRIDLVTDTIGMAWGRPYCKDPTGAIWFFGSRGGVYRMALGSQPERVRQAIEERLAEVNVATTIVRMVWDDLFYVNANQRGQRRWRGFRRWLHALAALRLPDVMP